MMRHFTLAAFVVVILVAAMSASATTYYIDPTFTGSPNSGTEANPYKAWSQVTFVAGNTYLQKCGTTATVTAELKPKSSNVIGSYGTGDRPIIHSTITSGKAINASSVSDMTVQDVTIEAPNTICCILFAGTCSNVTVDNCVLRDSGWGLRFNSSWSGATVIDTEIYDTHDDGIYSEYVSDLEVAYCYIHDVNQHFFINGPDEYVSAGDCLQLGYSSTNFYVHHNVLDHSATGNKFAFIAGSSTTGIVEYNHLIGQRPNGGSCMYLTTMSDLIIRHNILENSANGIFAPSATDGCLIYDNVFNHNDRAIVWSGPYPIEIYNNTFYDTGTALTSSSSTAAVTSKNNIFNAPLETDAMYSMVAISPSTNFVSDYNLVYPQKAGIIVYGSSYSTLSAWQTATGRDANSIAGDPLFVDVDEPDFNLGTGSPAIDAGVEIPGVTGSAPLDMGADVTGLAAVGIGVGGVESLAAEYVLTPNTDPAVGELVGCWHMDEGSGTTIEDESGYDSFGTISGATWTTGKWGSCLSFSNASSNFVLLDNTEGNLFIGQSSFTLAAWINPVSTQASGWRGIIGGPAALGLSGTGRYLQLTKTTVSNAPSSNYSVPLNTWTHVAVTFDSTATTNNLKYYINGSLYRTVTYNVNFTGQENLIGVTAYRSNYFDGLIDEVNIYNRVLTAAEVLALTNQAPTVSITDPEEDDEFNIGADITITAAASDGDGTVAKVEFYQGATKLGEDATSPYSYTWTGVAAGTYSLTAVATDDDGGTTTSEVVNITVNYAPTVAITDPANNDEFDAGDDITITASASDSDGTVAKVEFYQGATKLGEDATSPYSYTWTGVAAGTYSLTAVATDDDGATTTSTAVSITVVNTEPEIASWHLDENTGTTAYDDSGNGNDGTISGASWTTGVSGSALSFAKASSNYVNCGTDATLNMGTSDFSFAAWIYPVSEQISGEWRGVIGGAAGAASMGIKQATRVFMFTKVNIVDATSSGYTVPLNEWTHIAVTFDSTATTNNLKYYVNGTLVSTVTFNYDFTGVTRYIGCRTTSNSYFDGSIDEVGIYDHVLAAADVAALADQ